MQQAGLADLCLAPLSCFAGMQWDATRKANVCFWFSQRYNCILLPKMSTVTHCTIVQIIIFHSFQNLASVTCAASVQSSKEHWATKVKIFLQVLSDPIKLKSSLGTDTYVSTINLSSVMWVHIRHTSKEDKIRKGKPKLVLLPQGWRQLCTILQLAASMHYKKMRRQGKSKLGFFIRVCTTLHLSVMCAEACNPRLILNAALHNLASVCHMCTQRATEEDETYKESQSWFFLVFPAQSHICSHTISSIWSLPGATFTSKYFQEIFLK